MTRIDVGAALRRAQESGPAATIEILAAAARELSATDLVLYLVDFGQTALEPLPDRSVHADVSSSEDVGSTMAGRCFTDERIVTAQRDGSVRAWVPVLEGSDRTGVLAVTIPRADGDVLRGLEDLGILAGHLISVHARSTDVFNLYRRRRSMSLAASMQWDLLPPLVLKSGGITVAGLVEPAYDVGGDCFDYADNGPVLDVAIMDAMGHGLHSAVLANLAMGAYRHGRREARSLVAMHEALAATISGEYPDASFVTGVLARLDTTTGELRWTNAGHPSPLLIRRGRVVGELDEGRRTPPWGLAPGTPVAGSESLEPGDCVLLYTDGVIEARTPEGELFGLERLIDLTQNHASDLLRPEEIVRRLVHDVLEHQRHDLRDDATLVLLRWSGPDGA